MWKPRPRPQPKTYPASQYLIQSYKAALAMEKIDKIIEEAGGVRGTGVFSDSVTFESNKDFEAFYSALTRATLEPKE